MAENEAAVAESTTELAAPAAPVETAPVEAAPVEEAYQYEVKIEDSGPATKKVVVEIPKDRIDAKLAEQFKELRQQAAVPGFRPGHAPAKLIERRFGQDVKEQVRRALISESYEQAVEKNKLNVIGEPTFDKPDAVKLPEDGALSYSFEVEVQPDITLPDLNNLKIKKPKIDVTDENVQQAMTNLREQQGAMVPVEDRGVEPKDFLYSDIHVKLGDEVIAHQHDAQIVARPGRINGIDVVDLDKQLEGLKPGEERTIAVKVADTHTDEKIRGKDVQIQFNLKDIKKLEPAEINEEFLSDLGFENQQELLDALRQQMVERITYDVQQSMREQVNQYLLDNIQMALPTRLSNAQADRVVNRRGMDMMMRGIPRDQVEASLEKLRSGAKDEAARELKLFFILQKVAGEQNVDVDEAELNGRIAMLAAQRGKRPEKLKQEMSKDGTLSEMYIQLREQKAVDKLLEKAQIEEVDLQQPVAAPHA